MLFCLSTIFIFNSFLFTLTSFGHFGHLVCQTFWASYLNGV